MWQIEKASEEKLDCTNNQFVQFRLWDDCINNCTFCSLHKRRRQTPLDSKQKRLLKSAEIIENLDSKQIGLIGGDFFEGQLKNCEHEWMCLLDALLETDAQIFITANLIHEQHFLDETIEKLGGRLLLCTSYDEVGRFHTETARKNWFLNIEELHKKGVNIFCTCIQTEDFLTSCNNLPEWLNVNLCDPHLGIDWYENVDKEHYHEHLIAENDLFNLPKRRTAIKWMRDHPGTTKRYVAYNNTHSDTLYSFDKNDEFVKEFNSRLTSKKFVNPKCGHPFFSQCYADSDRCMMCDAQNLLKAISH